MDCVKGGKKIKRLFNIDNKNQNAVGFLKRFCFPSGGKEKGGNIVLLSNSTVFTALYGLLSNKEKVGTKTKLYPKFSSSFSVKGDILILLFSFRTHDIVIQQIQVFSVLLVV